MPDQWSKLPYRILSLAFRLRDAQIENQLALEIIGRYKFEYVLIYADPPYPLSTRHGSMYANEMTDDDHIKLLEVLKSHPGPVLLSGYACELYDNKLRYWMRKTHMAQAEKGLVREEVLWLNPIAAEGLAQQRLFDADTLYLQGRIPSPTYTAAIEAIRARVEAQGYTAGEIRAWVGPVQCWDLIWFEFLVEVVERDADNG